jgi:hypothetical protein
MLLTPPSWAGTEQDPEIADECTDGYFGGPGIPSLAPPAEMNVRSAWFEEIWEPGDGAGEQVLSALKVTLRVCADLDLVLPGSQPELVYSVAWDNGACRQSVRLIRTGETPTRVDARQTCTPSPVEFVTLPSSDYTIQGDRLIVTLRIAGPASQVMDGLSEGRTLGAPQAATWFYINPGNDTGVASSMSADTSGVGRDYVIGQHKPA